MVNQNMNMLHRINQGALLHFDLLGRGEHMERIDTRYYSYVKPYPGYEGIYSVFDVNFNGLNDEQKAIIIGEIKDLRLHPWWNVDMTDDEYTLVFDCERDYEAKDENAEWGMALEEKDWKNPEFSDNDSSIVIKEVMSAEDFKVWANIVNQVYQNGYKIIDPDKYYFLCQEGKMPCYIAYENNIPVSVVCMMIEGDIATMFFLATLEEFRERGIARKIASYAISETFQKNTIITCIAWPSCRNLCNDLGFKLYI